MISTLEEFIESYGSIKDKIESDGIIPDDVCTDMYDYLRFNISEMCYKYSKGRLYEFEIEEVIEEATESILMRIVSGRLTPYVVGWWKYLKFSVKGYIESFIRNNAPRSMTEIRVESFSELKLNENDPKLVLHNSRKPDVAAEYREFYIKDRNNLLRLLREICKKEYLIKISLYCYYYEISPSEYLPLNKYELDRVQLLSNLIDYTVSTFRLENN